MKPSPRNIETIIEPQAVKEGAGVHLRRSIGTRKLNYLDPFLLLDHFSSKNPADYEAGFPLHPHRGIETVTYMLAGEVRHRDTMGNEGTVGPGDVQWMTAGRGLLHEEMPKVLPEGISGFQLWVNLPAKLKMTAPRYQNISSKEIPSVQKEGATIRVIAGTLDGTTGPVEDIAARPIFLDVALGPRASFTQRIERGHSAFAYLFEGAIKNISDPPRMVVFGDGDYVKIETDGAPARFLVVSGRPLGEPIARYGPFVMNTKEEIEQTLLELNQGTFARV